MAGPVGGCPVLGVEWNSDFEDGAVQLRHAVEFWYRMLGDVVMTASRFLLCSAIVFATLISASHAGPCSDEISKMQARIDAKLEENAATGPTARQGVAADMHRQPTPHSIAEAEQKLGEVSPQTVDVINQAMLRARAADTAGDKNACEQALADAQRAISP